MLRFCIPKTYRRRNIPYVAHGRKREWCLVQSAAGAFARTAPHSPLTHSPTRSPTRSKRRQLASARLRQDKPRSHRAGDQLSPKWQATAESIHLEEEGNGGRVPCPNTRGPRSGCLSATQTGTALSLGMQTRALAQKYSASWIIFNIMNLELEKRTSDFLPPLHCSRLVLVLAHITWCQMLISLHKKQTLSLKIHLGVLKMEKARNVLIKLCKTNTITYQ